MYPTLQYFLRAYCTLSVYEDEIINVMTEFLEQEDQETIEKLKSELLHIKQTEAWEEGCSIVAKQGSRIWSLEETREHMGTFVRLLQNKKA
ncbi:MULTISPECIES: hypothetical protein [Bacillus]|uniref:Uncharacterized protein n=1 Tax=Bacillus pseudomycoides TaxID=64104 RepID=A0A1Y3MDR5_9BACI|nr:MULTISPECIES: hypothetical protein [Bacillus cereus group]EOP61072.1 hypothetical protein IIW_04766 [Bacillus cereus VD136]EOP76185.1 hypothetical protein KOW_04507 [Bacillus cereus VDM006]EOQ15851.1 hypothetical protein KOY_03635 [Bacillus cereus VDM021]OOG92229.1 hypothetical protein BTH41_00725 [Bacillus mycoides]MDF2086566.1 hypothetical protein [Bacillus pseudomycoides]